MDRAAPDWMNPAHPQWRDWRWQMRARIHTEARLREVFAPTPDECAAIEATRGVFRWNITPYYASLIRPEDPGDPVRRQVMPVMDELAPDIIGVVDPLEEVAHSPVKNLIHNYADRVAFCVTAECAIYCRYCLRKRMVGDAEHFLNKAELEAGLQYIASRPQIRDVLLTGGDPLTLSDAHLDWLLSRLRAIEHVDLIRIGSRMPVKLPYRLTPELADVLSRHHPVWLNTHFNHPHELTPDAAEGIDRLLRAGVPVGNQTVLLRGVNDRAETLKALFEGLVRMRVRPYYLYQAQVIGGTAHFRTPIETGMGLMRALQGRTTGFALPRYVLDTPFGKVPLDRSYVRGRCGPYVILETYDGRLWAEPNPLPPGDPPAFRLPEIPWPEGCATIEGAGAATFAPLCAEEARPAAP